MPTTYIIGHRKPDTDSVVSAMALAYLYEQEACFGYDQPQAVIVDPLNPETNYLFERFAVEAPPQITAADLRDKDQVVLVDHNEVDQNLAGLDQEQIVEIIDHHKINLNLGRPIFATFKTWGATATIVYHLMKQVDVKPGQKLAALMLAAILSDTVGFKSATTTDKDKKVGQKLAKIAQTDDLQEFASDIFKAKSNLTDLTPVEIVQNDYKIYNFAQKTFINQLETVEQKEILTTKKDQLLAAMTTVKAEQAVDLLFVAVTDVLQENTKLLLAGEAEATVAEKAFGGTAQDYVLDIGPRLSRKKQIAPEIEKNL